MCCLFRGVICAVFVLRGVRFFHSRAVCTRHHVRSLQRTLGSRENIKTGVSEHCKRGVALKCCCLYSKYLYCDTSAMSGRFFFFFCIDLEIRYIVGRRLCGLCGRCSLKCSVGLYQAFVAPVPVEKQVVPPCWCEKRG